MSNHQKHGIDTQANPTVYTAWCECSWTSNPTDYRPQAAYDEARHHLDATEPAIA